MYSVKFNATMVCTVEDEADILWFVNRHERLLDMEESDSLQHVDADFVREAIEEGFADGYRFESIEITKLEDITEVEIVSEDSEDSEDFETDDKEDN
jgi:hypothetical protein